MIEKERKNKFWQIKTLRPYWQMAQKSLTTAILWGGSWDGLARRDLSSTRPFLGHQESQNSFENLKCDLTWEDQAFGKPLTLPKLTPWQVQFMNYKGCVPIQKQETQKTRGRSLDHVWDGGIRWQEGIWNWVCPSWPDSTHLSSGTAALPPSSSQPLGCSSWPLITSP